MFFSRLNRTNNPGFLSDQKRRNRSHKTKLFATHASTKGVLPKLCQGPSSNILDLQDIILYEQHCRANPKIEQITFRLHNYNSNDDRSLSTAGRSTVSKVRCSKFSESGVSLG